jgi:hypothetical protein
MDFLFKLAEIVAGDIGTEEQIPHDKADGSGNGPSWCVIA